MKESRIILEEILSYGIPDFLSFSSEKKDILVTMFALYIVSLFTDHLASRKK